MSPMLTKRRTFKNQHVRVPETKLFSIGSEHELDLNSANYRVSNSVGMVGCADDGAVSRDV